MTILYAVDKTANALLISDDNFVTSQSVPIEYDMSGEVLATAIVVSPSGTVAIAFYGPRVLIVKPGVTETVVTIDYPLVDPYGISILDDDTVLLAASSGQAPFYLVQINPDGTASTLGQLPAMSMAVRPAPAVDDSGGSGDSGDTSNVPISAKIEVQHQVWVPDATKDSHGNTIGAHAEPITRYAQDFYPLGWDTSSPDVISADYEARLEFNMELMVPPGEAALYKKLDLVTVGDYTYEVQNRPFDWGSGLPSFAQGYAGLLGGTVHLRRVT